MKYNNQKGFTLMELLIVLSIGAVITTTLLSRATDKTRVEAGESFGRKLALIVSAMDDRFSLDTLEWEYIAGGDDAATFEASYTDINDFIQKELYSQNHPLCGADNGGTGAWIPLMEQGFDVNGDYNGTYYVNPNPNPKNAPGIYGPSTCFLLGKKLPFDMDLDDSYIITDTDVYGGADIVSQFYLVMPLSDSSKEKYMKEIGYAVLEAEKEDTDNLIGDHIYSFYDETSGEVISQAECLDTSNSCALVIGFETDGESRAQDLSRAGRNNMLGSINFSADPSDRGSLENLQTCVEWGYDPIASEWKVKTHDGIPYAPVDPLNPTPAELSNLINDCGVNYKTDESGDYEVTIASTSGSFTRGVSIDKDCSADVFAVGAVNTYTSQASFKCGIFLDVDDPNPANQTVVTVTEELISSGVFTALLNVANDATIGGNTAIGGDTTIGGTLSVSGETTLNGDTTLNNNLNVLTGTSSLRDINTNSINFQAISGSGLSGTNAFGISTNGTELEIETTGDVNFTGTGSVNFNNKRDVTTDKNISEFSNDKEFVSKEYVDAIIGDVQIMAQIQNVESGTEFPDEVDMPNYIAACGQTVNGTVGVLDIYVTPSSTFGTPVGVYYTSEENPSGTNWIIRMYEVNDINTAPSDEYVQESDTLANAVLLCDRS